MKKASDLGLKNGQNRWTDEAVGPTRHRWWLIKGEACRDLGRGALDESDFRNIAARLADDEIFVSTPLGGTPRLLIGTQDVSQYAYHVVKQGTFYSLDMGPADFKVGATVQGLPCELKNQEELRLIVLNIS